MGNYFTAVKTVENIYVDGIKEIETHEYYGALPQEGVRGLIIDALRPSLYVSVEDYTREIKAIILSDAEYKGEEVFTSEELTKIIEEDTLIISELKISLNDEKGNLVESLEVR